jgi:hypothetical protein
MASFVLVPGRAGWPGIGTAWCRSFAWQGMNLSRSVYLATTGTPVSRRMRTSSSARSRNEATLFSSLSR